MLLVLWDVDGTLVHTAGHGRYAFEEAYTAVTGRAAETVAYAGRTDHQIALQLLEGDRERLPRVLEGLAGALDSRREQVARDGHAYPGVPRALEALYAREGVINSLLTGNIEANAALKISAFGLERWLDFEVGAYGSDPHEERYELVAIARDRAERKYGEVSDAVLIGDTPLDVRAARLAGARAVAVATGPSGVDELREARPDSVFADLSDTEAAVRAITGE